LVNIKESDLEGHLSRVVKKQEAASSRYAKIGSKEAYHIVCQDSGMRKERNRKPERAKRHSEKNGRVGTTSDKATMQVQRGYKRLCQRGLRGTRGERRRQLPKGIKKERTVFSSKKKNPKAKREIEFSQKMSYLLKDSVAGKGEKTARRWGRRGEF